MINILRNTLSDFTDFLKEFSRSTSLSGKLFFLAATTGIVVGLAAALFNLTLDILLEFFQHLISVLPFPWMIIFIPALGGLCAGLIRYFSRTPFATLCATDGMIDAVHKEDGHVETRLPIFTILSSSFTIASGGSCGRECPTAYIGVGFASITAKLIKKFGIMKILFKTALMKHEERLMGICGAAAGIGAIFRSPIGAAVFSIEVLYRYGLEFTALLPVLIASVIGFITFSSFYSYEPFFLMKISWQFGFMNLFLAIVVGIVCVLIGWFYVRLLYGVFHLARKSRLPDWLKPAIGGLGQGIMVYFVADQLWGMGYEGIQQAIDGQLGIGMMILLVFGRILSTTFTLSSGGSGGVIAPSLFIGAMIGGAVGKICMVIGIAPQATPIGIYVVIGMASLYASVGKVPFALPLIIMEATHNMSLMLPLFVASAIGYMFSGRMTIYESQPMSIDSSRQGVNILGETEADLLESYLVKDFMEKDRPSFSEETTLVEVLRVIKKSRYLFFPVIQNGNCLTGAISIQSLKDFLLGKKRTHSILVKDVSVPIRHVITQDCTLKEALEIFRPYGIDHLPVVESDTSNKLVGILTKRAVLLMLKGTIGIGALDLLEKGIHLEESEPHDLLTYIVANEVMVKNVEIVWENMTVEKLTQLIEKSVHTGFPVVNAQGELLGMVTYPEIHKAVQAGLDTDEVVVTQIMRKDIPLVFPEDVLVEVVRKMQESHTDRIAVVEPDNPKRLVGLITRSNIMSAYQTEFQNST